MSNDQGQMTKENPRFNVQPEALRLGFDFWTFFWPWPFETGHSSAVVTPFGKRLLATSINIGDHAPSRGAVLGILGIARRHQGLLAMDSDQGADQNQSAA